MTAPCPLPFREIWVIDFEFSVEPGERPVPLCLIGREVRSGRRVRLWQDELRAISQPPFPVGDDTLVVAYFSSAEFGCFLALGWPMPRRVLDLFVEFRRVTSGLTVPHGHGLLGACADYGLPSIDSDEKGEMRQLALRGGDYTADEQRALLDYCQADVDATAALLGAMLHHDHVDLPRALLRGRYMPAVARMEWTGVPIDTVTLALLRQHWTAIQQQLVAAIDQEFGVYDGVSFRQQRFAEYLERHGIPWPRLPGGGLDLSRDAFREQARAYPQIAPLAELRSTLSELRLNDLTVGRDGRNRCLLSPFGSRTGRNQPSNSKFIFGPSTWIRSLIQPGPGMALAYIDYEQQEFGIGAALSGDVAMRDAYNSGDPYLAFAQQAGVVPPHATKKTHKRERDLFKICALGVQYGMGETALAARIGESPAHARRLIELHKRTYPRYWAWSDAAEARGMLLGELQSVFGWTVHAGRKPNPRSLRNFPLQANGAEILRLACCTMTESGIVVCAPVHDAVLIEAPIDQIERVVAEAQHYMQRASEVVLDGFPLRTEAAIVRHPDRYTDPRGERMWNTVLGLLGVDAGVNTPPTPVHGPSHLIVEIPSRIDRG